MALAGFLIVGAIVFIYKPTYAVTLDKQIIGYTENKSKLQEKINNYIENGNGENIAFVEINELPQYKLCFLKKDIQTNDDEIFQTIAEQGTSYYKYYAITVSNEEKYYVSNFEEAESVVNELKEKNSKNKDSLGILEKYETELEDFTDTGTCVAELYEKVVTKKTTSYSSAVQLGSATNSSGKKIELGFSLIRPTSGVITSRFGIRSRDNHKGIDIGASKGTSILAAASGTVVYAGYNSSGYGNHVIISHGNNVQTLYGHCSELLVSVGERVSQGELIARVGSTGISTGNHLHFEVRVNGVAQDPQNYVY